MDEQVTELTGVLMTQGRSTFRWPVVDNQGIPQLGVEVRLVLDQVAMWAVNGPTLDVYMSFGAQFSTLDVATIAAWRKEWEQE